MSQAYPAGPGGRPMRASRYTRRPPRPPSRHRLWRWAGVIALVLVVAISGVAAYVLWTVRDLPDPGRNGALGNSIVVYDRSGKPIEQLNAGGQYSQVLALKDMGQLAPQATLAAEDRNFYHHGPLDYPAVARAAFSDLLHRGAAQGASTITQQLVKISVLTPQRSIFRKMQEAVLATAMENKYSKDQILEMYLNRVFYGHNAYGIGAATKVYFGADKEARDLTPGQAAFLAGLINGPAYYDPAIHFDRAKERQLYVLDGMVRTGALTQQQADQAAQENIQAELKFDVSFRHSAAPQFVDYVRSKLEATLGSAAVQNGGFSVYTTLDLNLQQKAQQAVTNGVAALKRGGVDNGDLLAANPKTGEILAYVGSADYNNTAIGGQFDVIQAQHQPGSTFKAYVYAAALKEHKITLSTILHDRPTTFPGGYKPSDYDNSFMGDLTARKALVESRNIPAISVAQNEGMANVINLAQAMGVKSSLEDNLAGAIGGFQHGITMLDNVQGYGTLANQGTKVPLMSITKVTDAQGNVVFQQDPGKQAGITQPLTPAEAYLMTDTLKAYPGRWGLGWTSRQMAGKSGTTGGVTRENKDAWMMAYNPDIVIGAWAGKSSGDPITSFGVDVGSKVLAPFINSLPSNMKDWYHQPDGIVTGSGCGGSGGREIYLAGTQGGVSCPTPTPTPTPSPTAPPTAPPATPVPTPTGPIPITPSPSPPSGPNPTPSASPTH